MTDERTGPYVEAILAIARGEDALDEVEEELLFIAQAMARNPELHMALTNIQYPAERRVAALDAVIPTAHPVTRTVMAMLVAAGRAADLGAISRRVAERAAGERGRAVAEVYVAVPVDERTREQLREGLERATGKQLEVKVFVDPSVVGGVLAKVGDTVIDGSLARRLAQVRGQLT